MQLSNIYFSCNFSNYFNCKLFKDAHKHSSANFQGAQAKRTTVGRTKWRALGTESVVDFLSPEKY